MAWYLHNQKIEKYEDFNSIVKELSGDLKDIEARLTLIKFLRTNLGLTVELMSGVKLLPLQEIILKSILIRDNGLVVMGRGGSKSFIISILSLFYPIFYPDSKMVVISSNFRQSRRILDYSDKILRGPKASMLRECFPNQLRRANDMYIIKLENNSEVMALPLSNGSGLRGTRSGLAVLDEMLLINKEIQETIIRPFLSVKSNLTYEMEVREIEDELIKNGQLLETDRISFPKNKFVGFSSASYEFEYLYELFKSNVESTFHPPKNEEGDAPPTYFVLRASYESLPQDSILDMTQINAAKANGGEHTEYFRREYKAQFTNASDGYFNIKKLHECTIPDGDFPEIQLQGEKDSEYLLILDPSYSASKSSDYFAMSVFLLSKEERKMFLVHTYSRAGGNIADHFSYLTYLLTHFNIVMIGIDDSGSEVLSGFNESLIAKENGINIKFLKADLDDEANYAEELAKAKLNYNLNNKTIAYGFKFNSANIRRANEHLQNEIEAKKVWFASRMDADEKNANKYKDLISKFAIKNKNDEIFEIIEYIEDQNYWIRETKAQVALIQPKATNLGTITFDMPINIKRSTSENRPRKDNYTTLLIGNTTKTHYFNMLFAPKKEVSTTFSPIIIR